LTLPNARDSLLRAIGNSRIKLHSFPALAADYDAEFHGVPFPNASGECRRCGSGDLKSCPPNSIYKGLNEVGQCLGGIIELPHPAEVHLDIIWRPAWHSACPPAPETDAPIALRQIRTPTSANNGHRDCPAVLPGRGRERALHEYSGINEISSYCCNSASVGPIGTCYNSSWEPVYQVRSLGRIFRCGRA
jgi:hypothetical protein